MNRELLSRAAGVGIIALGCLLAYWAVWEPLELARSGAAEVGYRMKGIFAVPLAFAIGLAYLAGGAKADTLLRQPGGQRPTMWGWILTAVGVGLGILLYMWFNAEIAGLGYVEA
jgi:hypothetical protein